MGHRGYAAVSALVCLLGCGACGAAGQQWTAGWQFNFWSPQEGSIGFSTGTTGATRFDYGFDEDEACELGREIGIDATERVLRAAAKEMEAAGGANFSPSAFILFVRGFAPCYLGPDAAEERFVVEAGFNDSETTYVAELDREGNLLALCPQGEFTGCTDG
jgi:hypothetical protein